MPINTTNDYDAAREVASILVRHGIQPSADDLVDLQGLDKPVAEAVAKALRAQWDRDFELNAKELRLQGEGAIDTAILAAADFWLAQMVDAYHQEFWSEKAA